MALRIGRFPFVKIPVAKGPRASSPNISIRHKKKERQLRHCDSIAELPFARAAANLY
jgi:hypothetical protein